METRENVAGSLKTRLQTAEHPPSCIRMRGFRALTPSLLVEEKQLGSV